MDIIQTNPYRILGICSNSPVRERVSNRERMNAFLKVGKQVSFPMDLPGLLPTIHRSVETVAQADAKLTLPEEQFHYARFWFIKVSPIDEIAFNHLVAGNITNAVSIWSKKDDASSLQNCIVCSLIQNNYPLAISYAERLYSLYAFDFIQIVLGDNSTLPVDHLAHGFIDVLCQVYGYNQVLAQTSDEEWLKYIRMKSVQPLVAALQSAIDTAKSSKGKGSEVRLNAGAKLMNDTKSTLRQLKTLLPDTDLQYQMIADKLGIEILQCAIDYYNASEDPDAAHKAMELQSYAQSIVVGKMAKERCDENVKTLTKIIEDLPPMEVYEENEAIKEEMARFSKLPDKICHAVDLLKNCEGHLLYMRCVLGSTNAYYLKISTLVVNTALYNVIEEVNEVQKEDNSMDYFIKHLSDISESSYSYNEYRKSRIDKIKSTLKSAWDAIKLMDKFDMESDFKTNRYDENRRILQSLCTQVGVPTTPTKVKVSSPNKPTISTVNPSQGGSNSNVGCLGYAAMIAVVVLIIVASIFGVEGVATTFAIICGISVFGIRVIGGSEGGMTLILSAVGVVSGLISYILFKII